MFFILIFLIIYGLLWSFDRYFYLLIFNLLKRDGGDSKLILESLGYYNKSSFKSPITPFFIAFSIALFIYIIHKIIIRKKEKRAAARIKKLEDDLIKINQGDYSLAIKEDDELATLRDEVYKIIVNLKSLEEEAIRQRLNLKDDLSNIAHQLKTPLTSIGFMAELIDSDRENTSSYLDKLNNELDRLNNFTEILLKLSKINSNTVDYKYEKIDLRETFDDILNKLNRDKSILINFEGEDISLYGDDIWLYEAFLNIIKNSLEHTKDRLIIKTSVNPLYKEIFIKDNGPGMEEEKLKRIFERFYRGDSRITGYGIGLNLSKSIIEKHKGEICAYNEDGLTFHIKFYNVT